MAPTSMKVGTTLTAAVVLLLFGSVLPSHAQTPALGAGDGFEATLPYQGDATRMMCRIKADKFEPMEGGKFLLTTMSLEYFQTNGLPAFTASAPQCIYDNFERTANSPGKIKIDVGQGRFAIEGVGFLFSQGTNQAGANLILSNDVHAAMQRPTLNGAKDTNTSPMNISSRRFQLDAAERTGVFEEHVNVEDAALNLKCAKLTARASGDHDEFDSLSAVTNVTIISKTNGETARADNALYTRTNELMTLTGHVAWQQGSQRGSADQLVLDRVNKSLQADGRVVVKQPRGSLGLGGLLSGETNQPAATLKDDTMMDLNADRLLVRSNLTVITGNVRIQDLTNQLTCNQITITSKPGKAPETKAVGTGNVVVCRGDQNQCLRSDQVVYTQSDGAAVFTGQPSWKLPQSEGHAESVAVNHFGELTAKGDVVAKVILGSQTNSLLNFFPEAADTNALTRAIEIFAQELTANEQHVSLRGHARVHQSPITGSEPHLECENLDVRFSGSSRHLESLLARDQVRFEQGKAGITNGPAAHRRLTAGELNAAWDVKSGALTNFVAVQDVLAQQAGSVARGQRVAFNPVSGDLEMTGTPTLDAAEGKLVGAERIVWNKQTGRFSARGPFRIETRSDALKNAATNFPTK